MTKEEKIAYLSKNFGFLDNMGKKYLKDVSRQLFYIQHPVVPPLVSKKRRYARAGGADGADGVR